MIPTESEFSKLFGRALGEWVMQGRTDEQIWAVRNFLTGRGGLKLRKEILEWIRGRVMVEHQIDVCCDAEADGYVHCLNFLETCWKRIRP